MGLTGMEARMKNVSKPPGGTIRPISHESVPVASTRQLNSTISPELGLHSTLHLQPTSLRPPTLYGFSDGVESSEVRSLVGHLAQVGRHLVVVVVAEADRLRLSVSELRLELWRLIVRRLAALGREERPRRHLGAPNLLDEHDVEVEERHQEDAHVPLGCPHGCGWAPRRAGGGGGHVCSVLSALTGCSD